MAAISGSTTDGGNFMVLSNDAAQARRAKSARHWTEA
jgi:hypothetical protein